MLCFILKINRRNHARILASVSVQTANKERGLCFGVGVFQFLFFLNHILSNLTHGFPGPYGIHSGYFHGGDLAFCIAHDRNNKTDEVAVRIYYNMKRRLHLLLTENKLKMCRIYVILWFNTCLLQSVNRLEQVYHFKLYIDHNIQNLYTACVGSIKVSHFSANALRNYYSHFFV